MSTEIRSGASNGEVIRVAIADSQTLFRDSLRKLLDTQPGFEVVGEAADGVEAGRMVASLKPHVLLLEIDLPQRSGLEMLRELGRPPGHTRSLLLASAIKSNELIEALCVGAYGWVPKSSASHLLFKSIRAVMTGQYWLGRETIGELIRALRARNRPAKGEATRGTFGLTNRERGIVSLIVSGYTNKEIAQKLALGEVTVKHHLSNILRKLHLSSRLELAMFAVEHGIATKRA